MPIGKSMRALVPYDVSPEIRVEQFLPILVGYLDTILKLPEDVIIAQGESFDEKESAMYFIGRGDCQVNIEDQFGIVDIGARTLDEGDHFGEIQLIYKSHRSASVVSQNYNTLAKLSYRKFVNFVSEFPEFEKELIKHISQEYSEDTKNEFLKKTVRSVSYLAGADTYFLQKMIFSLKPTHVEEGDLVLAVGQKADAIIFVERGVIEVVTHFEGEEFIIDLLKSGSSINSHSYISEETMVVNYRDARDCHILKLHREDMDYMKGQYEFGKNIQIAEAKFLQSKKTFSLDYQKAGY